MANPYTRNIRYQYKPTDLSTIGKAAMMNQQQFDNTSSAIDEFDIQFDHLSQDADFAKKEMAAYRDKADALSEQLYNNKDPRTAMRELQKLNKDYKRRTGPGGDIAAVVGNYNQVQDYRKRHQKLLESGANVPANFEDFFASQMQGFKGTIGENGQYNSVGLRDMTKNKAEDYRKAIMDIAKMEKASTEEILGRYGNIGGFNKEAIDRITKSEMTLPQQKAAIRKMLSESEEFKPWLDQQKGIIDYRNRGFKGEEFVSQQMNSIDATIESVQAQMNNPQMSENEKSQALQYLKELEARKEGISQAVSQYGAEQVGKQTYLENEYNKLTGATDLLSANDFTDVQYNRSKITNHAGLAKYKEDLKKPKFELNESKEGTTVKLDKQSEAKIQSTINTLGKSIKDGTASIDDKKDYFLAKYYLSKGNEDFNKLYGDVPGISEIKSELEKSGVEFNDDILNIISKGSENSEYISSELGNAMGNILENASQVLTSEEKQAGYVLQPLADGSLEVRNRNGTKSIRKVDSSNQYAKEFKNLQAFSDKYLEDYNLLGKMTKTFKPGVIKNKLKGIENYSKQRESFFEEGIALDASSFKPDTKAAQKKVSADFVSNLGYNDFKDSMTQEEFNDLKQGVNPDVTPIVKFFTNEIEFDISYKNSNGEVVSRKITKPIYQGENTTQYSNMMGNWTQALTVDEREDGGKSAKLMDDLRVMKQYENIMPTFMDANGKIDSELFNVSNESINQFFENERNVKLHDNIKNTIGYATINGGSGFVTRKKDNTDNYVYYGYDPVSKDIVHTSDKDELKYLTPINKEQALETISTINSKQK